MAARGKNRIPVPPSSGAVDDSQGVKHVGKQLAATRAQRLGADIANRYAAIGARWLADPMPTRLDHELIDQLAAQGFSPERLAEIRVHRGSRAQAAADALDARAFALGDGDVFFAPGQFDPSTPEGRAVIAHEVAHVAPPGFAGARMQQTATPVLNERRRREDAGEDEAGERAARQVEAFVFAQEEDGAATSATGGPVAQPVEQPGATKPRIDPQVLEAKVVAILERLQRTEDERSGRSH